mgnify:CR=1 FL=1
MKVKIIPLTWIIAPLVNREQLERWHKAGFIDDEGLHLDRAFPRDSNGKPIIFRIWLRGAMNRALEKMKKADRSVLDFRIVDEKGLPIDYITINDKPLRYRRFINVGKKQTTEFFEYVDGTYTLSFLVETPKPKEFLEVLSIAGEIGLMSRTKHGFGKFKVEVEAK